MTDWLKVWEEVDAEVWAWRREHPRATLTEIERAVDERVARVRARLVTSIAQASEAAEFSGKTPDRKPLCPRCEVPLQARGRHDREVETHGGQELQLVRDYGVCPKCEDGFFPSGPRVGSAAG